MRLTSVVNATWCCQNCKNMSINKACIVGPSKRWLFNKVPVDLLAEALKTMLILLVELVSSGRRALGSNKPQHEVHPHPPQVLSLGGTFENIHGLPWRIPETLPFSLINVPV